MIKYILNISYREYVIYGKIYNNLKYILRLVNVDSEDAISE